MAEIDMIISQLKAIGKKPVTAQIGGFRPLPTEKSWFGGNFLLNKGETWPMDNKGNMAPVIQVFVPDVPGGSEFFDDAVLIQVFLTRGELPIGLAKNGNGWLLKEYYSMENLIVSPTPADVVLWKSFPIHWQAAEENDYPDWDEVYDHVDLSLLSESDKEKLDYFEKFPSYVYTKLGGYAAYIQGAENRDFQYVFQVSSEEKPGFMVGDSGNLYFYKKENSHDWFMYWDCY